MTKPYQPGDTTTVRGLSDKARLTLRHLSKQLSVQQADLLEAALDHFAAHLARRGVLSSALRQAILHAEQHGGLAYQAILAELDDPHEPDMGVTHPQEQEKLDLYRLAADRCDIPVTPDPEFDRRRLERRMRIDRIVGRLPGPPAL
jgi:hypothetical protein